MNHRLAYPLLASCLLVPTLEAAESISAEEIFRRVSPSVVTVHALDEKSQAEGLGSGVVIAPGLIVTNCHVVQEAGKLEIEAAQKKWEARWIRRDAGRDLCLLSVAGLTVPAAGLRSVGTLAVGEPVFAVGNPLGFGLTISSGLLSSVAGKGDAAYLVNTAAQSPGSSGGGLFDSEGRLLGITTAILGTGQNLNLALAADGVGNLLGKGKTPTAPAAMPAADRQWEDEAVALQRRSDWKNLETHALAWRNAQSAFAPPLVFLALAQQEQGRSAEALKTLDQALAINDRYAFAWLTHGIVNRALGRQEAAEASLARAERIFPNYAEPSALRAGWALQAKNPGKARDEARKMIRLDPSRPASWRLLGQAEEQLGHGEAAIAAYRVALRQGDTSPQVAQGLAQKPPASGNKPDEASAATAKSGLTRKDAALSEISIGQAELKLNHLGPAEAAMRKAIEQAPEITEAWLGLAAVLVKGNRPREAEQAQNEAIKRQPNNADMLANRAVLRRELGNHTGAQDDVQSALRIDPKNPTALRIQGIMYAEARKFREAVSVLAKLDEYGGATPDDLVTLGDGQAEIGAYADALRTLGRVDGKATDNTRFFLAKAKAQGRSGDFQGALASLESALKIDPTNPQAWSSKGYTLLKLGRLPEAVETLETAVRLTPDFANAWINLGEALMRSKNFGRAITALEKAIALAPEAMDARIYLGQSYLASRIAPKAREQADWLIAKQPAMIPAHGILTISYLIEGNVPAASQSYRRLWGLSPVVARGIRQQAMASGIAQAKDWPE